MVTATIKFKPVYRCGWCMRCAEGLLVTVEAEGWQKIEYNTDEWVHDSRHMPVGWSSYYENPRDVFKCEKCK